MRGTRDAPAGRSFQAEAGRFAKLKQSALTNGPYVARREVLRHFPSGGAAGVTRSGTTRRNRSETRNLSPARSVLRCGGGSENKDVSWFFGNPLELFERLGYH